MNQKVNLNLPKLVDEPGVHVIPFPTDKYSFRAEVTSLLIEKGFLKEPVPLEELHLHVSPEDKKVDEAMINNVTQSFYEVSSRMREMYLDLVKYLAHEVLKFDVIFQDTLSVRFHFPGNYTKNRMFSNNLYLGHHSDTMLGHPFEEINFWLPLTECRESAALMVGSREHGIAALSRLCEEFDYDAKTYVEEGIKRFHDKILSEEDYRSLVIDHCPPIGMSYGEFLMFDSRCLHGPNKNTENQTRISMDFRLIPVQLYQAMPYVYSSAKSGRKFAKGDVFYEKTAYEL